MIFAGQVGGQISEKYGLSIASVTQQAKLQGLGHFFPLLIFVYIQLHFVFRSAFRLSQQ